MDAVLEQINSSGKAFIDFALPMLIQSSVLIVVLLGLDAILSRRIRAVFRYWIWMIVLVKLMLPTTLALPTSPTYWLSDGLRSFVTGKSFPAEISATSSTVTNIPPKPSPRSRSNGAASSADNADLQTGLVPSAGADRVITPAMSGSLLTWQGYVLLAWLASVVLMMTLLIQRALFVRSLVTQSETASDTMTSILQSARQQMHVTTRVGLRHSQAIAGPCVCGLVRPIILIPQSLSSKVSEQRFKAILLHELAHIKRGDLWVSCIQTIVQIVYVYHPLLWVANAMIRKVREQAADEMVLVALGEEADDYPKTLLDVSRLTFGSPALSLRFIGVAESKKALHRRIKHMLTRPVPKSTRIGALGTIAIIVVAAVLLPMARAEKSNKDASATPQVISTEATEKAPPASESDTIVDPKTGLKFTVAKKISGENDVVVNADRLRLSPNGKFLLYRGQVVPLDGGKTFKLEALHGTEYAAWSSDGKLIAYWDKVAIWLLPVSPETGQPTGPARKLLDDQVETGQRQISWSRDSQWIILSNYWTQDRHHTAVSVQDGRPMQPLDYTLFSLRSPDQKSLAYFKPHNGVWTMPVQGGASRLAVGSHGESAVVPLWWSPDADWLLFGTGKRTSGTYDDLRFVRLADHRDVELRWFPQQVGREVLGVTPDGKKLQFYKTSYEIRRATKVASIRGGRLAELAFSRLVGFNGARISSPDGRRWFFMVLKPDIGDKQDTYAFAPYVAASAAADPVEVKLPEEVKRQHAFNYWSADRWLLSPDGKRLVRQDEYVTPRGESVVDLYSIPISLEKAQSTGPATLIAQAWSLDYYDYEIAWSPDSSRLAIYGGPKDRAGLWVVPADGSPPKQLTQSPKEYEESPRWSPDGKFIAYRVESAGQVSLYTVSAEGGASKRLWTKSGINSLRYTWFPDSKEIGLASDGAIVAVDIADGSVRPFLNLAEGGFTQLQWFQWSPDGRTLGLYGNNDGEDGKVALFHVADKKIEMLHPDPDPGEEPRFDWTGDSQSIFCTTWQYEKVRPATLIYEVDLVEAWTQAKNSVADVSSPASASPIAKLEAPPLVNGEFRDDFEDGDTRYWTFDEPSIYDHVREVQNGELVLENTRAFIGLPEWTNYVVTVRLRIKEATGVVPWSGGFAGVGFRRAEHGEYCLSLDRDQKALWFGVCYWDVDYVTGMLAEPAFNYVMDKWYTIQVEVKGPHIVVRVDGQPIIDLNDENCPQGAVTLVSGVGSRVHFDDFSVRLLQ